MQKSDSAGTRITQETRKRTPALESKNKSSATPAWNGVPLQTVVEDPMHAPPAAMLALQRAYGNQMVQRLLSEQVQRSETRAVGAEGGELNAPLQEEINSARGGGQPLDGMMGSRLGQSLGSDLSGVRVHTDAKADSLSRSLSAEAFTLGSDMFFRKNKYNPDSSGGQKLIAHESAHVVQQGGAKGGRVQTKLRVGPAGDGYEREADRFANQVMSGGHEPGNPSKVSHAAAAVNPGQPLARKALANSGNVPLPVQVSQPVSSGPEGIQRLMVGAVDFRQNTNKGTQRRRGDILNMVDKLLAQYLMYPVVIENDKDRRQRVRLLDRMETTAKLWVTRHDVYGMFDRVQDKSTERTVSNKNQGEKDLARQDSITEAMQKPETMTGKSRQDSYLSIIGYLEQTFIPALAREKLTVTATRTATEMDANGLAPVKSPERLAEEDLQKQKVMDKRRKNHELHGKLQSKYKNVSSDTGKLFGTVIPGILQLMAPGPGDLGKFTFEVQIPLEAAHVPWFVGGKVYLEGERKESNEFKSKFKASFKTGPRFAHASLYGEVGAQIESQAQTPEEVSNLFSYGLYRRFRESSVVPRGVTSMMWGGAKGTRGYLHSEKWAGNVENEIFGTADNAKKAYVDLGGYGGVGGGVEFSDSVKATGAMERYKGKKYNKHTITTAKGELGATQFTNSGKQASLGQSSRRYEFGGALSASIGIGGSGDFKLKLDQVKAVTDPKVTKGDGSQVQKSGYKGHYKTAKAELEINAMVNIPAGGALVERIVVPLGVKAASGIRDAVQLYKNKENRGKVGAGMAVDGLEEAAGSFERNIELNQIAASGFLGGTGDVSSTGVHTASHTVAGLGKSAGTGGGVKLRAKLTKEHEQDLSASKWKLQGDLYSVNKLGASFAGNKVLLDKSTRLGLFKWETGGKMKFELLGFATTRAKTGDKFVYEKELAKPKKYVPPQP